MTNVLICVFRHLQVFGDKKTPIDLIKKKVKQELKVELFSQGRVLREIRNYQSIIDFLGYLGLGERGRGLSPGK